MRGTSGAGRFFGRQGMARNIGPFDAATPPAQQPAAKGTWAVVGEQQQCGTSLADRLQRWEAIRKRQQRAQSRMQKAQRLGRSDRI
jgi:hypothetical protein